MNLQFKHIESTGCITANCNLQKKQTFFSAFLLAYKFAFVNAGGINPGFVAKQQNQEKRTIPSLLISLVFSILSIKGGKTDSHFQRSCTLTHVLPNTDCILNSRVCFAVM